MKVHAALLFGAAIALLFGCAKNESGPVANTPAGAVRNPIDFPVYPNSVTVAAAAFDQAEIAAALKKNGQGSDRDITPYKGNEVLLRSPATLSQLESWVGKLRESPPAHLKLNSDDSSGDKQLMDEWGVRAVSLESGDKRHQVFVLVMDPKRVYDKIGPVIDLADKYKALPPMLRGGLEEQVKKQTGVSISQMLDKSNPVGMTLWGVKELKGSGQRAIVLLDAVRA